MKAKNKMNDTSELVNRIKTTMQHYIRPREQVAHIRKVLSLHLNASINYAVHPLPLTLPNSSLILDVPLDTRGLQGEYLKVLKAHLKVLKEYEAACNSLATPQNDTQPGTVDINPLRAYTSLIKLRQKREKLLVLQRYLKTLGHKPAASSTFLEPNEVLRGCSAIPETPLDLVDGFVAVQGSNNNHIKKLGDQLEKTVLRAKLLLKKEEGLLEELRAKNAVSSPSNTVRLHALNAARSELINWIETELSKTGDGGQESNLPSTAEAPKVDQTKLEQQILAVKETYAAYTVARQAILADVDQVLYTTALKAEPAKAEEAEENADTLNPTAFLATPFLESMLEVAHEQKGFIQHKSNLNVILAKQLKETCQGLDMLAEESQLLPDHGAPGASRWQIGMGDDLRVAEKPDTMERVKSWVHAAESAKIRTLEAVMEQMDEGRTAVEMARKNLEEISRLLGMETQQPGAGSKDPWAALDGKIGLIAKGENV